MDIEKRYNLAPTSLLLKRFFEKRQSEDHEDRNKEVQKQIREDRNKEN